MVENLLLIHYTTHVNIFQVHGCFSEVIAVESYLLLGLQWGVAKCENCQWQFAREFSDLQLSCKYAKIWGRGTCQGTGFWCKRTFRY